MDTQQLFLQLIRAGIGQREPNLDGLAQPIDWLALQALAEKQGLSAIVLDGVEKLPLEKRPQKKDLLQWIGEVLQMESDYSIKEKASAEMALLFENCGIRTYVLKGTVVSECYPNPIHRTSVDMDCFLVPKEGDFDAWEKGNQVIEKAGFDVKRDFYKNSTCFFPGMTVENHQFLTPFRGNKRIKNLERLLQSMIRSDKGEDVIEGTCLCRPPVMVTALFLVEHAYSHFLHEGLTWKLVLDWMMFSSKHQKEIDWTSFGALVDEFGFRKFYDSFVRLGKYLLGVIQDSSFTLQDKRMLEDTWADLDLHEFHGVKGKMALAGNEIRAAWKYKYFSPDSMMGDLFRRVKAFLFERHPKL